MTTDHLHRLAALDRLLASSGVCAIRFAQDYGVADKTIRRDLELLHELSDLTYIEQPRGRRRWFYADGSQRIFSRWFAGEADE